MNDMCACPGRHCHLKDKCKRFTMVRTETQAFFMEPPIDLLIKGECTYFIPSSEAYLGQDL